ncbi:MAG TPA: SurA N-terminal domain-containing protein [Anaerolineaceae bacterium]
MFTQRILSVLLFFALFAGLLSACGGDQTPTPGVTPSSPPNGTPIPSKTPFRPEPTATFTPSPTPVPLAARVNKEGITLAEYEAELLRLKDALAEKKTTLTPAEQQKQVLDELIAQVLLAQAAVQGGYKPDEAAFQARLKALAEKAGGEAAFKEWLNRNHYTEASFKAALQRAIAATWQRDKIIASVPEKMEQIHARQILVSDPAVADSIQKSLQAGTSFANLATRYDPLTGGDMGWFPRGYMTVPEAETIAFSLQPNQASGSIKTKVGYLFIQVLERDPQRPLSPDARQTLQHKALAAWVEEHRKAAQVEILLS